MVKIELNKTIQKEKLEFIQGQIDKIRNSVENIESEITGEMVKRMCERTSCSRAKLKAESQEERL